MKMIEVGDRVLVNLDVPGYEVKNKLGTVYYIDHQRLLSDYTVPVQVELDEPYNEEGQTFIKVNLKELKIIEEA